MVHYKLPEPEDEAIKSVMVRVRSSTTSHFKHSYHSCNQAFRCSDCVGEIHSSYERREGTSGQGQRSISR